MDAKKKKDESMKPVPGKLDELRLYAHAAPLLMPLLERRKTAALKRLVAQYRAGENLIGTSAEIAVLEDLESELRRKHLELQNYQGE